VSGEIVALQIMTIEGTTGNGIHDKKVSFADNEIQLQTQQNPEQNPHYQTPAKT